MYKLNNSIKSNKYIFKHPKNSRLLLTHLQQFDHSEGYFETMNDYLTRTHKNVWKRIILQIMNENIPFKTYIEAIGINNLNIEHIAKFETHFFSINIKKKFKLNDKYIQDKTMIKIGTQKVILGFVEFFKKLQNKFNKELINSVDYTRSIIEREALKLSKNQVEYSGKNFIRCNHKFMVDLRQKQKQYEQFSYIKPQTRKKMQLMELLSQRFNQLI